MPRTPYRIAISLLPPPPPPPPKVATSTVVSHQEPPKPALREPVQVSSPSATVITPIFEPKPLTSQTKKESPNKATTKPVTKSSPVNRSFPLALLGFAWIVGAWFVSPYAESYFESKLNCSLLLENLQNSCNTLPLLAVTLVWTVLYRGQVLLKAIALAASGYLFYQRTITLDLTDDNTFLWSWILLINIFLWAIHFRLKGYFITHSALAKAKLDIQLFPSLRTLMTAIGLYLVPLFAGFLIQSNRGAGEFYFQEVNGTLFGRSLNIATGISLVASLLVVDVLHKGKYIGAYFSAAVVGYLTFSGLASQYYPFVLTYISDHVIPLTSESTRVTWLDISQRLGNYLATLQLYWPAVFYNFAVYLVSLTALRWLGYRLTYQTKT
jgi:hypothetical protein